MSIISTLDSDQREIRDVGRRFLEDRFPSERVREVMESADGCDRAGWQDLVNLGWTGVGLSEDLGGAGYDPVSRALLLEEMGRVLVPVPYLSTAVFARDVLAAIDRTAMADEILSGIASGSTQAAVVAYGDLHAGVDPEGTVEATDDGGDLRVRGNGGITLDGATADHLVVIAAVGSDVGVCRVDPMESSSTSAATIDQTRRFARVNLNDAPASRLDRGGSNADALRRARAAATIGLAAEMVGGAQRCVDMTVGYALQREQFGVLIGSFQSIKHRLADLAILVDAARETVYLAAELQEAEADTTTLSRAASAAKATVSTAYEFATNETIQLHGGIGFTWEHDAHLYFKRARVSGVMLGSATEHRARLGWSMVS